MRWWAIGATLWVSVVFGAAWIAAQSTSPRPILECRDTRGGIVSAPGPAPADFRVELRGGSVVATWTDAGRAVTLMSTGACLYYLRGNDPPSVGAE